MTLTSSFDRFRPAVWFGFLLFLVVVVEHEVTALPEFVQQPALPLAVTLDLLLVVPGLFYVLIVRRYGWPLSSLVGAFGAGLALGYWLIPAGQQHYLQAAGQMLVLLEAVVMGWALISLRRIVRAYRTACLQGPDFMDNLAASFQQSMGRTLFPLLFEVSMVRYGLLGWRVAPEVQASDTAFSSHRESGFPALVAVATMALLVESAAVHLLVSRWSAGWATFLLIADVYTVVMLLAHSQAVRLRPTFLTAEKLVVRVGFAWKLEVPRAGLLAIEMLRDTPSASPDTLNLSKLIFATPNLLLTFAQPVAVRGPYGIRRVVRRVALYLDQPRQFMAAAGLPPFSLTR